MIPRARHLLLFAIASATAGLTLAPLPAFADDPQLPGGQGVETETYESTARPVGEYTVRFAIEIPEAWHAVPAGPSVLFEPEPNPADLGLIVYLVTPDAVSSPADALELLDGIILDPIEASREDVTVRVDGRERSGVLLNIDARFDDKRDAHFLVLVVTPSEPGPGVVVFAGASDDAWGPWRDLLRDFIISLELTVMR